VLQFGFGDERRTLTLDRTPFSIGRKADKDLCIPDPRISREHAAIVSEGEGFFIEDRGSTIGTYINGERITRRKLNPNDRVDFGENGVAWLIFAPQPAAAAPRPAERPQDLLNSLSGISTITGGAGDLERLALCLEAARKLNTSGVREDILATLIEATLRLTHAERGYVFLRDKQGALRLAAGRDLAGHELTQDNTISHSILNRAVTSGEEFVVGDTSAFNEYAAQASIMAHDLRMVVCLPLSTPERAKPARPGDPGLAQVHGRRGGKGLVGALYLDSRFASRGLSNVSHDLLRSIAAQAAALVENAQLAEAEEAARRYEQELAISSNIQQRLMKVVIPETPFARVAARNIPCKDIGGDFFDVVAANGSLSVVVADVCGKGVSAALMASILQGMVYTQLMAGLPLAQIAAVANHFLCQKELGEKYATMTIGRLHHDGRLEMINCGHVPPVLFLAGKVERTEPHNFAIGLIDGVEYQTVGFELRPADHLLVVTDGTTEAQNARDEFFGDERLEQAAAQAGGCEAILAALDAFRGETPFQDDCTVLELTYTGVP
jgi:serine phosphatase RsbU (regulator of sigma subunit)